MIHAEKNVFRVKSCFFDQFLIYDIYIYTVNVNVPVLVFLQAKGYENNYV